MISKEEAIDKIKKLKKDSKKIFGFDGFIVSRNGRQIEQDFSRDYSNFTEDQQYQLCLEYFNKVNESGFVVKYELSHE